MYDASGIQRLAGELAEAYLDVKYLSIWPPVLMYKSADTCSEGPRQHSMLCKVERDKQSTGSNNARKQLTVLLRSQSPALKVEEKLLQCKGYTEPRITLTTTCIAR